MWLVGWRWVRRTHRYEGQSAQSAYDAETARWVALGEYYVRQADEAQRTQRARNPTPLAGRPRESITPSSRPSRNLIERSVIQLKARQIEPAPDGMIRRKFVTLILPACLTQKTPHVAAPIQSLAPTHARPAAHAFANVAASSCPRAAATYDQFLLV